MMVSMMLCVVCDGLDGSVSCGDVIIEVRIFVMIVVGWWYVVRKVIRMV